jgi:beta propeller domain-containing protein
MSRRGRRISGIGLTVALLFAGAAWLVATSADGKQPRKPVRTSAFRSCEGLVGYARSHGLEIVEARERAMRERLANTPPADALPLAMSAPQAEPKAVPVSQEGTDHSTTNVQEAGADEPDIVKTDGSRIFAAAARKLHAVEATGGSPRLVDSLALEGSNHELLLRGDRLLVISTLQAGGGFDPVAMPAAGSGARAASYRLAGDETLISEVNVRNRAAMRVTRTLRVGGRYVSSRLNGGTARLVIGSHPRALDPASGADPLRAQVTRESAGGWLPSYVFRNRRTGRTAKHRLVRCRSVRHAPEFSGLDLLTVLTIDLDKGLPAVDSDALMTDAETVYASSQSLYVASEKWLPEDLTGQLPPESRTAIHKFDISAPDRTFYRASGYVPGFLLNQFALSEHRGFLRAASTNRPSWWAGGWSRRNESFVTVLDERDGKLAQVGQVGGLGRGEQIYAVRFIGDNGFVVTFRQTDPLYTIDLSSPHRPTVLGELKIRGYSAYLHPVGNDLLIGVGQDATEQGRTLGTQISLFDVSDLSRPARLQQRAIAGGSSSEVEYDHHAFLYWPPTKLAVVPVTVYGNGPTWGPLFGGAVGFRVSRESGIAEVGRVTHEKPPHANADAVGSDIRRSLVVGRRLYTVSDRGVEVSSLDTLAELAWVPFG